MLIKNRMTPILELPSTIQDQEILKIDDGSFKKAIISTCYTVGSAFIFGILTYYFRGNEAGLEFFTGYLVEQSLSVDNLFVFLMLFNYFKVPPQHQGLR